jgi:exodeoxyribonuclease VII small subunit
MDIENTQENLLTLELCLQRLEEINRIMKSEGLSLDDSIELYAEGARLAAFCYEKLDKAELKIEEISKTLIAY